MSNFWPHRTTPKGFSIEELAKNARQKLAKASNAPSEKINHQPKILKEVRKNIININKEGFNGHWANRYFEEYREVA
tara:strand:+ start:121 stop:351 length:231 start_codon:yes stop_codon:yes gene_type:complete